MADKEANLVVNLVDKASNGLGSLIARFTAVGTAVAALTAFLTASVKQFVEHEQVVNRLNLALKNQGIFTDELSKEYQKIATQIAKVTTFTDEQIIETQTLLTTFGLAGSTLRDATRAALDLSKGLGIDLRTATLLLGKAAVGETGSLSRFGIKISDSIEPADKLQEVLRQVNDRFGGSAQADLETTAGKWANIKNRFFELAETVGSYLIPIIDILLGFLEKLVFVFETIAVEIELQKNRLMEFLGVHSQVIAQQSQNLDQFEQKTRTHLETLKALEKKNQEERAKQRKAYLDEQEALRRNKAAVEDKIEDELQKKNKERLEAKKEIYGIITEQIRGIASSNAKAQFIADKAFALSTAIMNIAQGVTKALALGPIIGPPLAGLITALGAAQIGVIGSQTISGLAEGGIVLPTPGGTIARIGEGGSAEAVIPLDDRANGLTGPTININVGTLVADDVSIREFARRIDQELFSLNRNRQSVSFG